MKKPTTSGLLKILRDAPGTSCHPLDDADALLASAERHGLVGVLQLRHDEGAFFLSDAQAKRLSIATRGLAFLSLRCRRALHAALDALATEQITPVLLKGIGLANRVWPDPLLRPTTDVDLLVEPETLDVAQRVLADAGFAVTDPALAHFQRRAHHHLSLHGPLGVVELHFRVNAGYGRPLEFEDMASPRAAQLDGRQVRYLQPEDEWPYLAVHASVSRYRRLSWVWELARYVEKEPWLLRRPVPCWVRERRLEVAYWCALDVAQRLFDLPVLAEDFTRHAPGWAHRATLRTVFSEERLLAGGGDGPLEQAKSALLCDDFPSALRFSGGHLAHVARRRLAERWPGRVPWHWRG